MRMKRMGRGGTQANRSWMDVTMRKRTEVKCMYRRKGKKGKRKKGKKEKEGEEEEPGGKGRDSLGPTGDVGGGEGRYTRSWFRCQAVEAYPETCNSSVGFGV